MFGERWTTFDKHQASSGFGDGMRAWPVERAREGKAACYGALLVRISELRTTDGRRGGPVVKHVSVIPSSPLNFASCSLWLLKNKAVAHFTASGRTDEGRRCVCLSPGERERETQGEMRT